MRISRPVSPWPLDVTDVTRDPQVVRFEKKVAETLKWRPGKSVFERLLSHEDEAPAIYQPDEHGVYPFAFPAPGASCISAIFVAPRLLV